MTTYTVTLDSEDQAVFVAALRPTYRPMLRDGQTVYLTPTRLGWMRTLEEDCDGSVTDDAGTDLYLWLGGIGYHIESAAERQGEG